MKSEARASKSAPEQCHILRIYPLTMARLPTNVQSMSFTLYEPILRAIQAEEQGAEATAKARNESRGIKYLSYVLHGARQLFASTPDISR